FAPDAVDPSGHRSYGQAGYGPLDTDGTREEGADFYEYMGVPWEFPASGEHKNQSPAEWEHNLDCSGFIRMVYGYHMGIPLVYDLNHDGLDNLPRTSKDQANEGPGAVVASSTSTPPALTKLQIGDTVYFDAEGDDDEIDHVGIHVGTDQHGLPRFVSSRKSGNGPTFADLGGDSVLTGSGLYAQTLRIIRRF
ncbi:NlpC/P60 family protein, partial [Kibdelosporangium lantanae]